MGGCVNALRVLVTAINVFFWIAGIVLMVFGAWLLYDPSVSDFFDLNSAHPGSFMQVGWLMIAAGLILFIFGFLGCCGALKLNQCCLFTFFLLLIVVFCLEIAAAVIAYNKQEHIRGYVENSMSDTIRNRYGVDDTYKKAVDTVQQKLQCCGVKTYSDWMGASWDKRKKKKDEEEDEDLPGIRREHGIGAVGGGRGDGFGRVPESCCNEIGLQTYPNGCGVSFNQAPLHTYSHFLHEKGCADALTEWAYSNLNIAIIICVVVAAIQLLGMVFSMILCCCVNAEEKKGY